MPTIQQIRKIQILSSIVFICLSFFSISKTQAVEVKQLDQAKVPVANRTSGEYQRGLKTAFGEVLIKHTGDIDVLNHPSIKTQLQSPAKILTQYGYIESEDGLLLQASFDDSSVVSLLRQAGIPVWGQQRPLTLFWIALSREQQKTLLADDSPLKDRQIFSHLSQSRGMPFLLPLMDLDDVQAVSVDDVRGMFANTINGASKRYQTDYIAIISLDQEQSGVSYALELFPNASTDVHQPVLSLSSKSSDSAQAFDKIISSISGYYVSKYATEDSGQASSSQVAFSHINNMTQLVNIQYYLEEISAVKSVKLTRLQGNKVFFDLQLFGSQAELYQLLNLDPKIESVSDLPETNLTNDGSLETPVYRWQVQ